MFKAQNISNHWVTEVRNKILTPLDTTGGNSFSLERFENCFLQFETFRRVIYFPLHWRDSEINPEGLKFHWRDSAIYPRGLLFHWRDSEILSSDIWIPPLEFENSKMNIWIPPVEFENCKMNFWIPPKECKSPRG